MGSRFVSTLHTDFCYNPIRISKNGSSMYVPCGKCNGCLLQKANFLSFRLGDEIENSPNSIFFTLTYSNEYVPKMRILVDDGMFRYVSAAQDVRCVPIRDGKVIKEYRNVLRSPIDFYSKHFLYAPLKNYDDDKVIGYCSKSDIQLWLKLLRKDIYENFNISGGSFRYYIISEYGPGKNPSQGKYRPHYHGIIFPCNSEVASFLLERGLYANWKMCDKGLFDQYTKYCDSGTRHYVTEYITGTTYLPQLLRDSKEVKPFVLMSKKDGAIGSVYFDKKKVLEDIERGVDRYYKSVSRIERNYIFLYPSKITNTLFPKCTGFNLLSFDGLLRIYGYLYDVQEYGKEFAALRNGYVEFSAQDATASRACLKVCNLIGWSPYHYLEVLIEFYYRKAMEALRYQYTLQEQHIDDIYWCIAWYQNSVEWLSEDSRTIWFNRILSNRNQFLHSFGIDYINDMDSFLTQVKEKRNNDTYMMEVDSIIENADKSKKVNAVVGLAPHIV